MRYKETSAWQVRETLDNRLGINSKAESMWKCPAPDRWEQGRSAVAKKATSLIYFSVASRGALIIEAARRRIDLPRD